MTEYATEIQTKRISPIGVVVGVLASLLLLGWLVMRGEARPLKPVRPTATPGNANLNSQPIVVTFEQLNADPAAFRNQRIRVTGNYIPQPKPDCFDYTGLVTGWALISGELQLNGAGLERVLRLVPPNTALMVDGIWTLYDGPTGCGKGAARAQTWYLQIERIVQPNPLPDFNPAPGGSGELEPGVTPLPDDPTSTPAGDSETAVSPTPNPALPTLPSSLTDTPNPLATATPDDAATVTPAAPGTTPTPANNRPTEPPDGSATAAGPTATPPAGSATPTASSPSTPGTPAPPTPPPLATSTPGPSPTPGSGYPGPTEPPPPSVPAPTEEYP